MQKIFSFVARDQDGQWLTKGTFATCGEAQAAFEQHPEEPGTEIAFGQLLVQKRRAFPAEAAAPPAKAKHAKAEDAKGEHAKPDHAEAAHAKHKATHKHKG